MNLEMIKHLQKMRWEAIVEYCQSSEEEFEEKADEIAGMLESAYEEEIEQILCNFHAVSESHGECAIYCKVKLPRVESFEINNVDNMFINVYIIPLHINADKIQWDDNKKMAFAEELHRLNSVNERISRLICVRVLPTGQDWCPVRSVWAEDKKVGEEVNILALIEALRCEASVSGIKITLA